MVAAFKYKWETYHEYQGEELVFEEVAKYHIESIWF